MPSPVQSNCDAHDIIANGQYGAVWSMGHTQQVCVRIVLLPSNVWQQFFGRSAFLRQQETDLPPAKLCPAENSLAVLNHKILEATSQVQNVKLGGHPTCLSINRLWPELCDMLRRLVGTTAPGHHDCSIQE
ncbi:uncharacterized protein TNCV_549651 [Trichonephila clavipes]|nr:uncharacterized protein TNCV_549651 [Trichonephila clavipes]